MTGDMADYRPTSQPDLAMVSAMLVSFLGWSVVFFMLAIVFPKGYNSEVVIWYPNLQGMSLIP